MDAPELPTAATVLLGLLGVTAWGLATTTNSDAAFAAALMLMAVVGLGVRPARAIGLGALMALMAFMLPGPAPPPGYECEMFCDDGRPAVATWTPFVLVLLPGAMLPLWMSIGLRLIVLEARARWA